MTAAVSALGAAVREPRAAVAVSGGRDSVVLLDALCAAGVRPVAALTIEHGLSPHAGAWTACAAAHAQRLQLPHHVRSVTLHDAHARGVEEAARMARYEALEALCIQSGANVLALAHHLDDVAETVLLQALRGSGPAGLAAMPALQFRQVWWWRPLLAVSRRDIDRYVVQRSLPFVHDASNDDPRFARNALRHQVLPVVERHFPSYRRTLARVALLAAQADSALDELAEVDLASVAEQHDVLGQTLRWSRWRALSEPRRARVLRRWLACAGLRAPTRARLADMQRQLADAAPDAAVELRHLHARVRRWRDWIVLDCDVYPAKGRAAASRAAARDAAANVGASSGPAGSIPEGTIIWRGERRIELPALGGVLHIEPESAADRPGLAHDRLSDGALVLRLRRGGERIRLASDGPSRTLKNVFQEQGVPAWQRARLPIAYLDEQLLWVAGIGFDARATCRNGRRYGLRWEAID